MAAPAEGLRQERSARRQGGTGVMGGAQQHRLPRPTPRSPPTRRRGGAAAPASTLSRRHPPPQPPVPGWWEGPASPGRVCSPARAPTRNALPRVEDGRETLQPGAGVGVAEGGGRAFGAAAAARAESQAPPCGQGVLPPFSACLPSSSPLPRRCPGQQRQPPAARNSPT